VSRNGRHYVTDVWSQMTLFAIALPSPTYDWSTLTFCGVAVVTIFVALDIWAQHGRMESTRSVRIHERTPQ
jgi:hypothetical protein